MNKLPVVRTIRDAYGFTFTHLGTIIGLIWIPMVVMTLLSFLPALAPIDTSAESFAVGTRQAELLAIWILTVLLYAMIYTAVTRQALGLRTGPAHYHFALGQPEFRVFGAVLLVGLISMACFLAFVSLLLAAVAASANQSATGQLLILPLVVAGTAGLAYVVIRLNFLVVPVTVAENRIDILRGWALSKGNVGRMFLVLVAVALPLALVGFVAVMALMGHDLISALPTTNSSDPKVVQQQLSALEDVIHRHETELLLVGLILAPFNLGLSLSAAAFGYRALAVPETPSSASS